MATRWNTYNVFTEIQHKPIAIRMRAAIEAMPFETPRVSAVAVGYLTGSDFASRLERAIERSNRAKLIELRPEPTD